MVEVDPDPVPAHKPGRGERARAKAARGDLLPKWQVDCEDPVIVRYHCKFCPRHFGVEDAAWDHLRDVHGVSVP
jgi:hypothetical protein